MSHQSYWALAGRMVTRKLYLSEGSTSRAQSMWEAAYARKETTCLRPSTAGQRRDSGGVDVRVQASGHREDVRKKANDRIMDGLTPLTWAISAWSTGIGLRTNATIRGTSEKF